jgi:Acetyltransferase (GNAT) domain
MNLIFEHFDNKKNLAQQRELFKDCFPETNGDEIQSVEHYLWKFHSSPNVDHSWEYAAYIDEEMVGYYAAIPFRYKIGETYSIVGMVCDVMTSTRQRGKGIFAKIGSYATQDLADSVSFTTGYPIRKEVIPGHLKVGWKIAFPLPLYLKFIATNTFLKTRKAEFLAPVFNPLLKIYNFFFNSRINKKYSSCISDKIEDIQGYNSFVASWGEVIRNSLIKDYEFARWRYGAPGRIYKFLTILFENSLVGFVSFRKIVKEGVPSYGILDYMVLPGYEDCYGLIIKVLRDEATKDNVECILCMMSKYSANKYKLLRNGFFKSPFTFQLIIKNLSDKFTEEELFNEANWHLMWVDSDDL